MTLAVRNSAHQDDAHAAPSSAARNQSACSRRWGAHGEAGLSGGDAMAAAEAAETRRATSRKGGRQRQKPSAPLPGRAARPVKPSPSAAAPSPYRAQFRPISPHPCRHQIPRGCWASGAVFSLQRSRRRVGRRRRRAGPRGQNGCMRDGIAVRPVRYAWIVP